MTAMTRTARRAPLLLLLLLPAACAELDPFQRAGAWRPTAANEANLRAMVERPDDLAEGRGAVNAAGFSAAAAVDRLRGDRVRTLPDSGVSTIGGAR